MTSTMNLLARTYTYTTSLFVLLLFCTSIPAIAQLTVIPPRVVLSSTERSGEVEVKNPMNKPVIINVRLHYSVMRTDSLYQAYRDTVERGTPGERSAVGFLRVFPKQFTLNPGEARRVKVLASPPPEIADGEWMARLEVNGTPVEKPENLEIDTTKLETKLNYTYAYNLPVLFRKGQLETGLEFDAVKAMYTEEKAPSLILNLGVKGNAAYRGMFIVSIAGANKVVDTTFEQPVVAEVPYQFPIKLPYLSRGTYTVKVTAATQRRGSIHDVLIKAPATSREFTLTLRESDIVVAAK
jgi:P pilus assembly chaperone PapD